MTGSCAWRAAATTPTARSIAGALEGRVYALPEGQGRLPDFETMTPLGSGHLMIADVASGAAAATMVRSKSKIGRRWSGCLAKKPSTGAPRSARRPNFLVDVLAAAGGAFFATTGFFFGRVAFFTPP